MRHKFRDLVAATMSPEAERRAHDLAQRDLAEMELVELREALKVSQDDLAKRLKVTQVAVSRLERRPNMLLETLSNYIEALGGELELRAVLPNRTVKLSRLLASAREKVARPRGARVIRKKRREAELRQGAAAR